MAPQLEHANLCVRDIDGMIRFLTTAFPQFRVRHDAIDAKGMRWVHIGTDATYIALNQATATDGRKWVPYVGEPGVQHLGYEVDDAMALRDRMLAAGYTESTPPNDHPHRVRVYFYDAEGNDWEFVQYFSDDPAERNQYEE